LSSQSWKIAFLGATGAGKTTAIRAISDRNVIDTDVESTDEVRKMKVTTTAAIDYGEMDLDSDDKLLLYGLPGQSRFEFMFGAIRDNLLGVILLVDGTSAPVRGLDEILATHTKNLSTMPVVVAINKLDDDNDALYESCLDVLAHHGIMAPVERIDARSREDVIAVFDLLLLLVGTTIGEEIEYS
jgi:hypothetical protein